MKRLAVASILVLAACNKGPAVNEKNVTPEQVAQKVSAAEASEVMISPGLWQSSVTIEKVDVPGVPPSMAGRMKSMMAQNGGHDFQTCLTAEDVRKPKEDFFAGKNNECRYEHFTMGDGKVDALMHCGGQGHASTMHMTGTYSPDSYQMRVSTDAQSDRGPAGAMQMEMRIDAKKIGQCSAKQG